MNLSRKGAIFIGRFEGWVPILYNDIGDNAHIGYGHKLHDGPYTAHDEIDWNPPITKDQGLKLLQTDALDAEKQIHADVKAPLRQGQFDALVSFTYNLGVGTFHVSRIPALLNARRYKDARRELLRYDHVGTERVAGLTKRRKAEARLFRTGSYFLAQL